MEQQTISLLESITLSLDSIARSLQPKPKTGFGKAAVITCVDCYPVEGTDALWGIYHGDGKPKTPLPPNLRCQLIGAYVSTKVTSKGDSQKFRLWVRCGEDVYSLESGLLTKSDKHYYNNLAGSLLAAIEAMTAEQMKGIIDIYIRQGDDKNALFSSVYSQGRRVRADKAEPIQGDHVKIISRMNSILDYEPPEWTLSNADRIAKALTRKGVASSEIAKVAKSLLGGRKSSDLLPDELNQVLNKIQQLSHAN